VPPKATKKKQVTEIEINILGKKLLDTMVAENFPNMKKIVISDSNSSLNQKN
jgi:Glu-tRNA(Gln) amidotransferase subunit E-like FAD-binding protein